MSEENRYFATLLLLYVIARELLLLFFLFMSSPLLDQFVVELGLLFLLRFDIDAGDETATVQMDMMLFLVSAAK